MAVGLKFSWYAVE